MRITVLGGDGFCGWPSALHLAGRGHQVTIVDNLSRRHIGETLRAPSLTPISPLPDRVEAGRQVGDLRYEICDIARDYGRLCDLLAALDPEVVVHFAEQRSAPYSMLGCAERTYTINNNVSGTNNLLSALVCNGQRPHIVHLGTMGVYGYKDEFGEIPEGYLDVEVVQTGKRLSIPYPGDPGSIYHLTKVLDHQLLQFYAKNWGFAVTDLHQGIVWGTQTEETGLDEPLVNRFDYDGEYGTVLNRLITQAQIGHPLTVYGSGGQTRAFIHIRDTVRCIALACENPPPPGSRPRVFNQVAEIHTVADLARMIADKTGAEIRHLANPRKEPARNALAVCTHGLRSLGFEPTRLDDALVGEIETTVQRHADRIDRAAILSRATW